MCSNFPNQSYKRDVTGHASSKSVLGISIMFRLLRLVHFIFVESPVGTEEKCQNKCPEPSREGVLMCVTTWEWPDDHQRILGSSQQYRFVLRPTSLSHLSGSLRDHDPLVDDEGWFIMLSLRLMNCLPRSAYSLTTLKWHLWCARFCSSLSSE